MPLTRLSGYDPTYKEGIFGGRDIKDYEVYDETGSKAGSVYDALIDDAGNFRYIIVDAGFWSFGKKVLVPIGHIRMDESQHRVYLKDLTREQTETLPKYKDGMTVDYDYEEQVRDVYRPTTAEARTTEPVYERDTYSYDEHDASLYAMNEQDHQSLKLYEERIIADKQRAKSGEVAIGKRVETETAQVAVPVEKERVVIERSTPAEVGEVAPGSIHFQEGEVARVEVYEEEADVQKQAFVREEVEIRKEVERDTVEATETVRREELDVDVEGDPNLNNL